MKRIGLIILALSMVLAAAIPAVPAFASDSLGKNWRVYNVKPDTSSYWDINQVERLSGDGFQFPIQQFVTTTTGSFAVYLLNNYNVDATGKTMTASLNWTGGTYKTRSDSIPGAYVRFEFQDVTAGPYDSNDYWWSTLSLDLNAGTSGLLEASLADRSLWTNQSGKSATDTTEDWVQWQGDIVHMSPYDGFTKAIKNVKQIGLSFGNAGRYASGVALDGSTGTFQVISFTIQ